MILSDEQINSLLQSNKNSFSITSDLVISHLEANARIKELEAENKQLRDNGQLTAEEVKGILDSNTEWLDKRHAEIDAIEDRADLLAVIADALAVEVDAWQHDSILMSDKKRAIRAEAKLRELVEAAEWRDECDEARRYCFWRREDYSPISMHWHRWGESLWHATQLLDEAEAAYQAALKAAKEDQ